MLKTALHFQLKFKQNSLKQNKNRKKRKEIKLGVYVLVWGNKQ